jgi:glycosyltransferase involved in cell wall biosynthesis
MNMSGLVSVIIPSYNCEEFINETIDSVLAQNYESIELLIVDDGSTDKTQDIIQTYGHRVRLISQKNSGVCAARNRGVQEATGQYICLMDHDDYWYSDKISRQINAFNEHPETGIVYSDFFLWHPDSSGVFPKPESLNEKSDEDGIDQDFSGWIYHQLLLDCRVLTSTAMFRSEVFQKCGFFDEALPYSEDWELWLRLSREYRFLKIKRPTTLYRQHPHQGNRKVRTIDHRSVLLSNSVKKWGLCSQDGRCVSKRQFYRQLAEYHASFGLHHLIFGNKKIAIISLFKAWATFPPKIKYIAYILVGLLGWKPNW